MNYMLWKVGIEFFKFPEVRERMYLHIATHSSEITQLEALALAKCKEMELQDPIVLSAERLGAVVCQSSDAIRFQIGPFTLSKSVAATLDPKRKNGIRRIRIQID